MAAEESSGIIGNAIAFLAIAGGSILTAFAVIKSLINSGRDAREARALVEKHDARLIEVEGYQRADIEVKKNIRDTLERIEGQLAIALRGTGRRG